MGKGAIKLSFGAVRRDCEGEWCGFLGVETGQGGFFFFFH